jgi:uncharacterized protein (DUF924 family)
LDWIQDINGFWFGELDPEQHWRIDEDVDGIIRHRFLPLWEQQKMRVAADFAGNAETALAAVIMFDQFPRNMFRGSADAYSTDHLAIAIARQAITAGLDDDLSDEQKVFLYLPFMHSENREDQAQSVALFTALGRADNIRFANEHFAVINKFGRFPHRNAVLGRAMRPGEQAAIDHGAAW